MAITDFVLTINGTDYDLAARLEGLLGIDAWGWDLDGDCYVEFHELTLPDQTEARFNCSTMVSLTATVSGSPVVVFSGVIAATQPFFAEQGLGYGYQCLGFKYLLNQVPVVGVDGANSMMFNDSPLDVDYYVDSLAGLTVGQIITDVLTQHAGVLATLGITADATTGAQLAAMTIVPPDPVVVGGSRLCQAIEQVLQRWQRNYVLFIRGDGVLRFFDTTAGSALTLTYGADPITWPLWSRDTKDCATRIQVVGQGSIYPAYVSLTTGELARAWTSTQQTNWKWSDYATPADCYDQGTVTTVGSPTSVTVQSASGSTFWSAHFWPGRKAWIYLKHAVGTGLTYQESREITDNTALLAGGTSDITLANDLENAGASAYDSYTIIGNPAAAGVVGQNAVWRLYNIVDPGGQVADHLVTRFPTSVAFFGYAGLSETSTYFPQALIVKSGVTVPATFKILPLTGQILFDQPVVAAFTQQADLVTGGTHVTAPDDIYVLLAYSRGALIATYPPDISGVPQYQGTAHTVDGVERTRTLPVDSWVYAGNTSQMLNLAQMYLESMQDTVITGGLQHYGLLEDVLMPSVLISVASTTGTTGFETAAVPVRSVRYLLSDDGQGIGATSLQVSSRRNPRTGDQYYAHPATLAQVTFKLGALDQVGFWNPYGVPQPQLDGPTSTPAGGGNGGE